MAKKSKKSSILINYTIKDYNKGLYKMRLRTSQTKQNLAQKRKIVIPTHLWANKKPIFGGYKYYKANIPTNTIDQYNKKFFMYWLLPNGQKINQDGTTYVPPKQKITYTQWYKQKTKLL